MLVISACGMMKGYSCLQLRKISGLGNHTMISCWTKFPWNADSLSDDLPMQGPVRKAMSKMKFGKPSGPSGIIIERMRSAGDYFLHKLTCSFIYKYEVWCINCGFYVPLNWIWWLFVHLYWSLLLFICFATEKCSSMSSYQWNGPVYKDVSGDHVLKFKDNRISNIFQSRLLP